MAKDREAITSNGRAAFYASIWPDLRQAAMDCGWALGLHGSLASDMDIMAMPWTGDASPVETMIQTLSDCFVDSPWGYYHAIPNHGNPHNRVTYTMSIWANWYLDISVIEPEQGREGRHVRGY